MYDRPAKNIPRRTLSSALSRPQRHTGKALVSRVTNVAPLPGDDTTLAVYMNKCYCCERNCTTPFQHPSDKIPLGTPLFKASPVNRTCVTQGWNPITACVKTSSLQLSHIDISFKPLQHFKVYLGCGRGVVSPRGPQTQASKQLDYKSTPVSVNKTPSVLAAWQALYRHSKSPH